MAVLRSKLLRELTVNGSTLEQTVKETNREWQYSEVWSKLLWELTVNGSTLEQTVKGTNREWQNSGANC